MSSKSLKQKPGKYGSMGGNGGYAKRKPVKDVPNPSKSKKEYIDHHGNNAAPRAAK